MAMRDGTTENSNMVFLKRSVSEAIEKTRDSQTAVSFLEDAARKDKLLWRLLTDPFLRQACQQAIDDYVPIKIKEHGKKKEKKEKKPIQQDQRGKRLRHAAASLMDFRLLDGLPLGSAMKGDVLATAASYDRVAKSKARRGQWLAAIADGMPDDRPVSEVFTETDLKRFMREVSK
jgi:hypothetical protein